MLIKVFTEKTVKETAAALEIAVGFNYFGVTQVHELKESMARKGMEIVRVCTIFLVCQPIKAREVFEENMNLSPTLPWLISICREAGKTVLVTLEPTTLMVMFNATYLDGVAKEVEDAIVKMMQEAAG